MRWMVLLALVLGAVGCEKTIHEAHQDVAPRVTGNA